MTTSLSLTQEIAGSNTAIFELVGHLGKTQIDQIEQRDIESVDIVDIKPKLFYFVELNP